MNPNAMQQIKDSRIIILNDDPINLYNCIKYIGLKGPLTEDWKHFIVDNTGKYLMFKDGHPFSWISQDFLSSAFVPNLSYNTEQLMHIIEFDKAYIIMQERHQNEINELMKIHEVYEFK